MLPSFQKIATVFILILLTSTAFAQQNDPPEWVKEGTISNRSGLYFGIGSSVKSSDDADNDARSEFSKMISVTVASLTERHLSETDNRISERYKSELTVESHLELRGITISERYYDEEKKIHYSLIKYSHREYETNFKKQLALEITRLEAELAHQNELARVAAEEERNEIQRKADADALALEQQKAKEKRHRVIRQTRGAFLKLAAPVQLLDIENAEIASKMNRFSISPTLSPFGVLRGEYTFSWKLLSFSAGVSTQNNKLALQDLRLKFQVLSSDRGIYRSAFAIGVNQFSHNVSSFDIDNVGFSIFVAGNVSIPQMYSFASLYADIRKVSAGLTYLPLFDFFTGKLSVILQTELIFNKNYHNRFDDSFILEPGIRFAVVPDAFNMMISYEDNEFVTFSFDFSW